MKLISFKTGGIHPPQSKLTAGAPITDIDLPRKVELLLSQHIGAPAIPAVNKGDKVCRGQLVARAGSKVSAPIHTPISGTVTKIGKTTDAAGLPADAITIEATDDDHFADLRSCADRTVRHISPDDYTAGEIINLIADAGIVGLGGATFPTHVKLSPPPGMKAELLIINGAECEPYLTCDDALMRTSPREVIIGTRLLMKAAGVSRAIVGIEANKPEAIAAMSGFAGNGVEIMPLRVKYPQGGEKQLIQTITGREVPPGALPVAVGTVVQNVATAYAVWNAAATGQPLIERLVTVTGPAAAKPGNYCVPLGTPLKAIIGDSSPAKIILGGPMMGKAIVNPDAPTTKGVSGILLLDKASAARRTPGACIRCGECVRACPMGLEPFRLSTLSRFGLTDEAAGEGIMNCVECGSCSYVCPAARPILDFIRLGKARLRRK